MNPQLDIGVKLSGSDQFATEASKTKDAMVKMDAQAKQIIQTQKNLSKQTGNLKGVFGQLGYQVQDIAVQLQMGQNALLVFGQQGSQIASAFGGWGAIAGAVISVGAAISTYMMASREAARDTVTLTGEVEELAAEYKKAGDNYRYYARAKLQEKGVNLEEQIRKDEEALASLSSVLVKATEKQGENTPYVKGLRKEYGELTERYLRGKDALLVLNETLDDSIKKGKDEQKSLEQRIEKLKIENATYGQAESAVLEYIALKDGVITASEAEEISLQKSIEAKMAEAEATKQAAKDKLQAEKELAAEQKRLADKAIAEEQARKKQLEDIVAADIKKQGATGVDPEIQKLNDEFAARMEAKNAMFELEKITEQEHRDQMLALLEEYNLKRAELEGQAMQAQSMALMQQDAAILGQMQSMTQQLGGMFDEGSALGKAFFVANQAMAAGMAIVNGMMAASSIRAAAAGQAAMFPLAADGILAKGEIQANMAQGMGYVTAAMIAGQTLASFEGGGLTGSGVRSGGIDGKGGMIAMLHPNEKVTDLTKGGDSRPVNISFNITSADARDFDRLLSERQSMIVNMVNRAVNNSGRRLA